MTAYDPHDKRLVQRFIERGSLSREAVEAELNKLPDLADQAANFETQAEDPFFLSCTDAAPSA